MKKLFVSLFAVMVSTSWLGFPGVNVMAQDACSGISDSAYCQEIRKDSNPLFGPDGIGTKVTQVLTIISGLVSVIAIILGGIKFMSSSGEPQKVASAKNTVLYASIGIVVSLLAQSVVLFILSKL